MGLIGLLKFTLICIDLLAWPVLGLVYPLFASVRAIESYSKYHLRKLVIYWTIFSLISVFEFAFLQIIERIPFWSSLKLVITFWLVMPEFDGANIAYQSFVRPWLLVNLQEVTNRFYKPNKDKLHNIETFLDVADKYIKENGYEALEKLISIKRDYQVPENSQRDIRVLESEEKVVAATSEELKEADAAETRDEVVEAMGKSASTKAKPAKPEGKDAAAAAEIKETTTPPQDTQPVRDFRCLLSYRGGRGRSGYRGGGGGGGRNYGSRGRSPRSAGRNIVRQSPVGTHPDDASSAHGSESSKPGRENPEMTSINGATKNFNDMLSSDHSYRPNSQPSRSVETSERIHQGYNNNFPSLSTHPELNASTTQMIQSRDEDEENLTLSCVSLTPDDDATHKEKEPSERTSEFENSEQQKGLSFDICEERNRNVVNLKTSLLDKNRARRNEAKRRTQGNNIEILRTGMILLKGYLLLPDQVKLIKACRDLGRGSGGFYRPGYRDGATLHLKRMCLGKNWDTETCKYDDKRPIDGAKPPPIPDDFLQLVKGAIQECHDHLQSQSKGRNWRSILPSMSPNICIINFYTKTGKLGLHQDKGESQESLRKGLPVVSFSLGDSAEFLFGDQRDVDKAEKVVLESGDVLIFGGESRHIFHGVSAILPDTAPKPLLDETNLRPGRLNLTFREY